MFSMHTFFADGCEKVKMTLRKNIISIFRPHNILIFLHENKTVKYIFVVIISLLIVTVEFY